MAFLSPSISATIDRIHYLVEQASTLRGEGLEYEADLLVEEAQDHAKELRALQAESQSH